jgi:adenylate kinase
MYKFLEIILVTGTPGTGKTFFSLKLAELLDAKYMDLNRMVKEKNLILEKNGGNGTIIVDIAAVNRRINLLSMKVNKPYLIVDGHLSHLLYLTKEIKMVFVTRCDPLVLEKRLMKRAYSKDKIRDNVLSEILDTCFIESLSRFGKNRICELETSNKTVEENVKIGINVLNSKIKPIIGQIDWISILDSKNMLKKFVD